MAYQIGLSSSAINHLRNLTVNQRSTVLDAIAQQLSNQPTLQTKNRKPMRPNSLAGWELRVGNLRVFYNVFNEVFYNVFNEVEQRVIVEAVGVKEGNRLFIGGVEIEL